MNLLQNRKQIDFFNTINPISFRKFQHESILKFIAYGVNFVSNIRDNYLEISDISINEKVNYTGIHNSKLSKIIVKVNNKQTNEQDETFLKLYVPTLLEHNYYYLNGNYYTPSFFLIDYPIAIKKHSAIITTLFNSITFYYKQNIAIVTKKNIPLSSFIQLFIDKTNQNEIDLYTDFCTCMKIEIENVSDENLIQLFSSKFKADKNIPSIVKKLESIILDDYTKELYLLCYPDLQIPTLKNIILKTLQSSINGPISFIDFNFKRLVFLESILKPYFTRISTLSIDTSKGGVKSKLVMDELSVLKYFLSSIKNKNSQSNGLSGKFRIDSTSLYGLLLPKTNLVTPNMNMPPSEITNIHESSFNKACPITISNQDPGATVSLVPEVTFNEFGIFN